MKSDTEKNDVEKFLRLIGLTSIANLPFRKQISLMAKAGFQPAEIADLLDTTANSVRVRLSEMRHTLRKAAKS